MCGWHPRNAMKPLGDNDTSAQRGPVGETGRWDFYGAVRHGHQAGKNELFPEEVIKMSEKPSLEAKGLSRTYKVEDLMLLLNIGRNSAYEMVRSGRIRSFRLGRSYRVPIEAVEEFLRKKS